MIILTAVFFPSRRNCHICKKKRILQGGFPAACRWSISCHDGNATRIAENATVQGEYQLVFKRFLENPLKKPIYNCSINQLINDSLNKLMKSLIDHYDLVYYCLVFPCWVPVGLPFGNWIPFWERWLPPLGDPIGGTRWGICKLRAHATRCACGLLTNQESRSNE